jgi:shikimate kinase
VLIVLVGPKGSGKSHVGRTLERDLGIHFLHVEPLWMRYHAKCEAAGVEPNLAEGLRAVHRGIAEALRTHEHVCVETTGAAPVILDDLLSLAPPAATLVARLDAPLELCLERIRQRNPTEQIPVDVDAIRRIHALSVAAAVAPALTLDSATLSEDEIVAKFANALAFP